MLKVERQNLIEQQLTIKGSITIAECVKLLNVSEETVRRDFREMEKDNRLTRIHGGAYKPEADDKNVPIQLREVLYLDEKRKMAEYALKNLVKENDSIMIDASSTCFQLAKIVIASGMHVTIITNALRIMELFSNQQPNARLIAIGGKYRSKSCSFVGEYAEDMISNYIADKCFISTSSADLQHGFIDSSSQECQIHKKYLEFSKSHYLLLDHTKFTSRADYIVSKLDSADEIVTDREPAQEWQDLLESLHIDCVFDI